jgi:hypothetical protein
MFHATRYVLIASHWQRVGDSPNEYTPWTLLHINAVIISPIGTIYGFTGIHHGSDFVLPFEFGNNDTKAQSTRLPVTRTQDYLSLY